MSSFVQHLVWLLFLGACGGAVGAGIAAWAYRARRARKPPPSPRRRTHATTRRGRIAHAADIWRCAPAQVTEPMEKAALRDLYGANYGATRARRRQWIADNIEVPALPPDSILMDRPHDP